MTAKQGKAHQDTLFAGTNPEDPPLGKVYLHSCESMHELADGSVDLTVTSPPYWNAIDYDVHSIDSGKNYRPRKRMDYQAYLEFLDNCFREVLRVHKEGTICAVVIGTVLLEGKHTPLPYHFTARMEALGWEFFQDIIWHKCTGGVKRASNAIKHPYPGYFYPNLMTEYILLFRKGGRQSIRDGRSEEEREADQIEIDSVFKNEIANNVWHIAPVPPKQTDHPCPFPEEIPYRLVRWFTYQGDVVLDPFCGIGSTLKVAANLNRKWIGYEIKKKYAEIAEERVRENLVLRTQLIVEFRKIDYGTQLPPKNPPRARFRKT